MALMFGFGCIYETKIIQTPPVKQETEKSTLTVKKEILVPWEERKKNFWISIYFAKMSYDPNMRHRFIPHILYGICECIIGEFEKLYTLEEFETTIHNDQTDMISPEVKSQIWNFSYGCSQIGMQKQTEEMKKSQSQIPLKDAV